MVGLRRTKRAARARLQLLHHSCSPLNGGCSARGAPRSGRFAHKPGWSLVRGTSRGRRGGETLIFQHDLVVGTDPTRRCARTESTLVRPRRVHGRATVRSCNKARDVHLIINPERRVGARQEETSLEAVVESRRDQCRLHLRVVSETRPCCPSLVVRTRVAHVRPFRRYCFSTLISVYSAYSCPCRDTFE